MKHAVGIITVVQEGRFCLASEDGRSMLFALDHAAGVEAQDLPALLNRGSLEVAYTRLAGRHALTAHAIGPARR